MKRIIFLIILVTATFLSISGQGTGTAEGYFNSGVEFLRQNQYAEALNAFETSQRLNPRMAATAANIGYTYIKLKRTADAINAYQRAIDLDPAESEFRLFLCKALASEKEFDKAVETCKEAKRLAPDSSNVAWGFVDVLRFSHRPAEEIKQEIELALSRFPDSVGILRTAADYFETVGDHFRAAELYERLTQLVPTDSFYFARLADIYLKLNREVDAVAAARRALTIEPDNPYANYFMGHIFLELGLNQEAGDAFAVAAAGKKDLPYARYYLAVSEERRGHFAAALSAISEAAAREPDNFSFQLELGGLLNTMARYEDAIAPLRKAVALKPNNLQARGGLGLALFESANYSDGISILEETNRMFPGNRVITMYLGVARSRQAHVPLIAEKAALAKQEPKNIGVRVDLVELLMYSRRIDEAEPYVQEIWKLFPKNVKTYINVAVAYWTAGKAEQALDAYRRALTIADDPSAYVGFASIYRDQGKADLATEAYTRVLEIQPDASATMKRFADHLRDNGKRREALDMYKRSLALKPLEATALFDAAVLSFKLGDPTSGKEYLSVLRGVDASLAAKIDRCLRLRIWG